MDRKGILLVNLGSPASTSVADVRTYLGEFLMDPCVIDLPAPFRSLVVKGFILPFRPKHSAEAYASIWWDEGSPLIVISERLLSAIREKVAVPVSLGMRYGEPSIRRAMDELAGEGVRDVLLVPLYPHYAMATVKTVVDEAKAVIDRHHPDMHLRVLPPFYADPDYIDALATSVTPYLENGFDHLLLSYHGVPERHVKKTDPTGNHCLVNDGCCESASKAHETCYRHQVFESSHALIGRLGIGDRHWSVSFQSRLGMDAWLKPATSDELVRLAHSGVKRLVVMCPAFVSDCLETLEELGIRGREAFLQAGGEKFTLVPCLNDQPAWIETLCNYCLHAGFGETAGRISA